MSEEKKIDIIDPRFIAGLVDQREAELDALAEFMGAAVGQSTSDAGDLVGPDFNEISFEVKFRVEPIKAIEESEYILNEFMYLSFLLQARAAYVNAFSEWMKKNYPISGSDDEEQAQIEENYRHDIEVSLKNPASLEEMISDEAIQARIKECDALFKGPAEEKTT